MNKDLETNAFTERDLANLTTFQGLWGFYLDHVSSPKSFADQ